MTKSDRSVCSQECTVVTPTDVCADVLKAELHQVRQLRGPAEGNRAL